MGHELRSDRRSSLIALSLLVAALLAGCDETTDAPPECSVGQTRSCPATRDCRAEQACIGSRPHWGECRCLAPDASTSRPDAGPEDKRRVGAACDDDALCPPGAFCLTPDRAILFGGTSPIGVCVADCSERAADCDAFDDAMCVATAHQPELPADAAAGDEDAGSAGNATVPSALCFQRCTLGSADPKCHEQSQVACEPEPGSPSRAGYCRPICTTDTDCPTGHCDLRQATCVVAPSPPAQLELGASCRTDAASACPGLCVDIDEQAPICSHRCVFGSPDECAPGEATGRQGACVLTTPEGSLGDTGYCASLCDCPDDCPNTADVCDPFMDEVLERTLGRPGVCTVPELALHEPLVCK